MSELVTNRWRRFGHDRLYVTTQDGVEIGYWDLAADVGHPESPELESALAAAVDRWRSQPTVAGRTASEQKLATAIENWASPSVSPGSPDQPEAVATPSTAPPSTATPSTSTPPQPSATAPPIPWVDLAANRPGAAARERAIAHREAAPVRTFVARMVGAKTDERAWRIGADGEERVAEQLAKVARKEPRWQFLHAIPIGERGADIDHLAIGPGGVFTINAKHHPRADIWVGGNTFMINGSKVPYVRNARFEAARASELLETATGFPVHVSATIVTVNAQKLTIKSQPSDVTVVARLQFANWLLRHGPILDDDAIAAIYEAARRSTTWQVPTKPGRTRGR